MASASSTASPGDGATTAVVQDKPALQLAWVCGFNKDIIGGVQSLNNGELFYPAAHTGVIYDSQTGKQRLLQGHVNVITAVTVSTCKQWIVTADSGSDSMLVIWERNSGSPIKIMFSPYKEGVVSVDITTDSKYLVTLSAAEQDGEELKQYISVWDWTNSAETGPLCTALVGTQDIQTCVVFNKWDSHEIATNGRRRVFFWAWETSEKNTNFQFYSPALAAKDFKQKVSDFTQTIFLPESTQAATGTVDGDIVIWDLSLIVDGLSRPDERRAVKILKLSPDVSLNVLMIHAPFVVVGSSDGAVRFYDYQFRVQAWFEDLSAGSVTSLSFDNTLSDVDDVVLEVEEFHCPNFLVATASALVVACQSDLFFKLEASMRRGQLVLQGLDSPVHGICCHPSEPLVAVSGLSGFIHLWNYQTRTLQTVKMFEKILPQITTYAPNGLLGVGFTNGQIRILNSEMNEIAQFRESRESVSHLIFSQCCNYLAVAHQDRCVCLYRYGTRQSDRREWFFVGKHRGHWRAIVGLCFSQGIKPIRLYSLGEDRKLVEYEILDSSAGEKDFTIHSSTAVEQEARPTGLMFSADPNSNESALLIMNDEYKFKLFRNRSCRSTSLAPTYGGPLCKMLPIIGHEGEGGKHATKQEDGFLLYATHNKVIGVIELPLDGNPHRYMGLIAHPGVISAVSVDYQGKYAFSAGGPDLCVNVWEIDTVSVATASLRGGSGIEPYVQLLEGGEAFLAEIRDYFYYSQIRSKGEQTTEPRSLDGTIPLAEIPHLMCALGCFPTQMEIHNMTNEVRYSRFEQIGDYCLNIGFEDFIKLYINHRPVLQVTRENILDAFATITGTGPVGAAAAPINKQTLITLLTEYGERLGPGELRQCLEALIGHPDVDKALPDELVDPTYFAEELLGFGPELQE